MILLQLSSISSGWSGVFALAEHQNPATIGGEAAFFAAVGAGIAYAQTDPHWLELQEPGHFNGAIDDDCARLAGLTPEQRAELDVMPDDRKEFARRMITSKSWRAIVSRLIRQSNRKQLTTA